MNYSRWIQEKMKVLLGPPKLRDTRIAQKANKGDHWNKMADGGTAPKLLQVASEAWIEYKLDEARGKYSICLQSE